MIGFVINALALAGLLHIFAKHEADYELGKIALVVGGLTILQIIMNFTLGILGLPVIFGATAWAVHQFCYVEWPKSFIVAALYIVVQVLIAIAFAALFHS